MTSPVEGVFASFLEQDVRFGYLDKRVSAAHGGHPQLISNSGPATMLRALRTELRQCENFMFSVAFVSQGAIALLKQEFVDYKKTGTIVTSNYLGFNKPEAFSELASLGRLGIDSRFHSAAAYHPKGYVFFYPDRVTAILGSSNLTKTALTTNHEWNLKVSAARGSDLASQLESLVSGQLSESTSLTQEWIADYANLYAQMPPAQQGPTLRLPGPVVGDQESGLLDLGFLGGPVLPNLMQREALGEIARTRAAGEPRAVVISATGTGKTVLAALDIKAATPRRVLFVVHREQILDRAMTEFGWVLGVPRESMGKLSGGRREADRLFVFATIQTLSRPDILATIAPDAFDYVLIDEVHHAVASSYIRVIDHLKPKFLLGMTATPERTDNFNVFELFNFNVPYEIRLNRALEDGMLCPFHYYGVADVEFEDGEVASVETGLDKLASRLRIDHILDALETYGQAGIPPRGLIFCSRVEEARALAAALNNRELRGVPLRTLALAGDDDIPAREDAVRRLEDGELDYLITVDVFNEGVDIPSVNQVVMLRQTKSAIVFVQQLGRGLRKHGGKEYVVVIDFIGNYANNYMIPIALFGDESLNKESLRQHLISAEESGTIAGLSSIRFDRVSQQRVLDSITQNRLDSMSNLKYAFDTLRNRLGRVPELADFLRFDSADPGILATRHGNYPALVAKFLREPAGLSDNQSRALTFISNEVLVAKRLHEARVVRALLDGEPHDIADIVESVRAAVPSATIRDVESAISTLDLSFGVKHERTKYGAPLILRDGHGVRLTPELVKGLASSTKFHRAFVDVLETTEVMVTERYDPARPFTPGKQYSRKDASRLLLWGKNAEATIMGYRVHRDTRTCPIFVTIDKSEEVAASVAYPDELIDNQTMRWFTRNRTYLARGEVRSIVNNEVEIYVFAKKNDKDLSDFYYLGLARSEAAQQTSMPDKDGKPLPVVQMTLRFDSPIDSAVYDYFHPVVTSEPAT